jgi:hypothetical protein
MPRRQSFLHAHHKLSQSFRLPVVKLLWRQTIESQNNRDMYIIHVLTELMYLQLSKAIDALNRRDGTPRAPYMQL